ncbi:MAG: DUF3047 domain-containing protein [Mariprofundaceae bacterium]|nr:DUF3047 domain-containing protein [Mariprofundaceae bacterium]
MLLRQVLLLMPLCATLSVMQMAYAGEIVRLDDFSAESAQVPAPWQVVKFSKKITPTQYRIRRWDGLTAIEAIADRSMALLARPVVIDLNRTPVLCWHWRVDAPLLTADMATKAGDDYAARVYVAFDLPDTSLRFLTRLALMLARNIYGQNVPDGALSYVWGNRYPVGTRMRNAYTERARMIVAESGPERAGKWVVARHNLQEDALAEFGSAQARLIQIAVASDTDNTGEKAHAGFAGFHFVEKDAACYFK